MQIRTIAHLNADAFFASVDQAADTLLRGKPIAVGSESRGIITSASCGARKFGVYTPSPAQAGRIGSGRHARHPERGANAARAPTIQACTCSQRLSQARLAGGSGYRSDLRFRSHFKV